MSLDQVPFALVAFLFMTAFLWKKPTKKTPPKSKKKSK